MGTEPIDRDPFSSAERIVRPAPPNRVAPPAPPVPPAPRATGSRRKPRPPKVSYWDRPKPRRDWHWFLGRLGSTLIIAGLLVFLFVGYQLWGTGIEAAQSQERLEDAFVDLAAPSIADPQSSGSTGSEESDSEPPAPIPLAEGDPIALIDIPAIGVSKYVVAGVQTADLKKGPGHYPNTPLPGELGNVAIAGHRTTYGEPFRRIDELGVGDAIVLTDLAGRRFTYLVTEQLIVSPNDSWVIDTVDPDLATLTLTTCHPEFSAKQRLVVFAELDSSQSGPADFAAAVYRSPSNSTSSPSSTDDESVVGTTPDTSIMEQESEITSPSEQSIPIDDVFDKGWFSDPDALPQVGIWVLLNVLIVLGSWQIAKRLRNRAIGLAIGIVPFFVVLYFVFQNVNRLLPPNL